MIFASLDYVLFLTLVLLFFWALVRHGALRMLVLLVASWVFYMAWNATFILLIVGSTLVDYLCGAAIARAESRKTKKRLLIVSLVSNLGLLGLFKYLDFFIVNVTQGLAALGVDAGLAPLDLLLPVGISFYTFQSMSYTLDIYRGTLQPTRSFTRFALFVAFFPQLVAGPIVRASEFLPQLDRRPRLSVEDAGQGLWLILKGLCKKVLVADFLAINLIDRVFEAPDRFGAGEVLIAVYAYTWQLYGDFSGYTDIARGSARLIGFELPENFRRPFQAANLIEFWARWHITLTRWINDYLYISLGGSRQKGWRTYFNIGFTWLVMGLWHGAAWNFVLFGLWHAGGIILYRLWRERRKKVSGERPKPLTGWRKGLAIFATFHFHVLNWPLFRGQSLSDALDVYREILVGDWAIMRVSPTVLLVIFACFVVHFTPERWVDRARQAFVSAPALAQAAVVSVAALVIMRVASSQPVPFIYFQF